jgi:hypothetical protein
MSPIADFLALRKMWKRLRRGRSGEGMGKRSLQRRAKISGKLQWIPVRMDNAKYINGVVLVGNP